MCDVIMLLKYFNWGISGKGEFVGENFGILATIYMHKINKKCTTAKGNPKKLPFKWV